MAEEEGIGPSCQVDDESMTWDGAKLNIDRTCLAIH